MISQYPELLEELGMRPDKKTLWKAHRCPTGHMHLIAPEDYPILTMLLSIRTMLLSIRTKSVL